MNRDTKSLAQEAEKNGRKLTLEWAHEPDGSLALVFDSAPWAAYETVAAAKGQTASQMIANAIGACFGTIHADNYALNRFLSVDDPDFLRLNRKLK
jgi:hypothetical protein